ncbi:hypothetical protein BT96DRAFT_1010006 [Gymnopus androsaceus JB14]|uniref:Uncharacterized protein n=1 Tax=Gymnopus androsaceus JB14 TaxID=1447944 RepID=A0A6A4GBE7_9AGAR|nr:hypothetical protein BT96DRAFT_1010006 [Gymnopus androsaceus JB14]
MPEVKAPIALQEREPSDLKLLWKWQCLDEEKSPVKAKKPLALALLVVWELFEAIRMIARKRGPSGACCEFIVQNNDGMRVDVTRYASDPSEISLTSIRRPHREICI